MTRFVAALPKQDTRRMGSLAACPPLSDGVRDQAPGNAPSYLYTCHEIGTNTDSAPFGLAEVMANSAAATRAGNPVDVSAAARRETWTPCPRPISHLRLSNRYDGRTFPPPCRRLTCPSCIVWRALRTGGAIALAEPDRLVTVTMTGRDWPTIKDNLAKFRKRLRRLGAQGETAYHVEPFQNGDTHAHIWWRGHGLTHEVVGAAARSAGIGWRHHISPPPRTPNWEYGLKMILVDGPKNPTELWPSAKRYLELNGGWLVHASNDFWRDRDGSGCNLAQAEVAARNYAPGTWLLESAA